LNGVHCGGQARRPGDVPCGAPERQALRRGVQADLSTSFTREAFFAVTSFKFTNAQGISRHGRFRIRPEQGTEYLSNEQAAAKSANFLFDKIDPRLARGPVRLEPHLRSGRRRRTAAGK
jgi:hypothetical protein